ncbi:hypothetical protein HNQ07_003671 [Deinococcus metalli]|uniref:DUF4331 domain-containing protein n=1 Tax=Deinococcus metalli TaxID=1141878 RepID=A0A7W8NRS1_9DEIO|nr:hypothetical protein [Deinococcus metalli]MBB5378170.1 hypothetical protein [Deinococcus metalli]GHF56558.1 hypothetical protein GCM10017781_36090 [Deinococcus metalli]
MPVTTRPALSRSLFLAALLAASPALADADTQPAPPSIGADIPLVYFGPAPSTVNPNLVGPKQLLTAGKIDFDKSTITLPLYRGQLRDGRNVWYVLTDTDDRGNAEALGLNYSAKLTYAAVGKAVRTATLGKGGLLTFDQGTVDFAPARRVVAGTASAFPPQVAQPGSVGDAAYTPLVRITNAGGHIYNAPVVAFDISAEQLGKFCTAAPDYSKVHDKVVNICPAGDGGEVTLSLTPGFSFAKPVLYLSTEASDALPAAMEGVTQAPGLKDITVGHDDSAFSPVERLFAAVNGPTGKANPQRQGFNSALSGEGSPLNVLGGIPTVATDYSPLWDLNVYEWTKASIAASYRSRLIEEFQILGLAERGFITGPGGAPFGSSGFIVNCPVVWRFL